MKLTAEQDAQLKRAIDRGYHERTDYPPYALTPWDDRNRYREYIFRIIDEQATEPAKEGGQ